MVTEATDREETTEMISHPLESEAAFICAWSRKDHSVALAHFPHAIPREATRAIQANRKEQDAAMQTNINELTESVIGAAIEVHRLLGPGLLESAYQQALEHELALRGIRFEAQKCCPVTYKGLVLDDAYRLDFLVHNQLVVELKAVDALAEVHEAQVLTYLRFSGCRIGLLINFRSRLLKNGLQRLSL